MKSQAERLASLILALVASVRPLWVPVATLAMISVCQHLKVQASLHSLGAAMSASRYAMAWSSRWAACWRSAVPNTDQTCSLACQQSAISS